MSSLTNLFQTLKEEANESISTDLMSLSIESIETSELRKELLMTQCKLNKLLDYSFSLEKMALNLKGFDSGTLTLNGEEITLESMFSFFGEEPKSSTNTFISIETLKKILTKIWKLVIGTFKVLVRLSSNLGKRFESYLTKTYLLNEMLTKQVNELPNHSLPFQPTITVNTSNLINKALEREDLSGIKENLRTLRTAIDFFLIDKREYDLFKQMVVLIGQSPEPDRFYQLNDELKAIYLKDLKSRFADEIVPEPTTLNNRDITTITQLPGDRRLIFNKNNNKQIGNDRTEILKDSESKKDKVVMNSITKEDSLEILSLIKEIQRNKGFLLIKSHEALNKKLLKTLEEYKEHIFNLDSPNLSGKDSTKFEIVRSGSGLIENGINGTMQIIELIEKVSSSGYELITSNIETLKAAYSSVEAN